MKKLLFILLLISSAQADVYVKRQTDAQPVNVSTPAVLIWILAR